MAHHWIITLAALLLVARPAGAQPATPMLDAVRDVLRDGDRITVREDSGRRTTGRLVEVSADTLVLSVRDSLGATRRTAFDAGAVAEIRRSDGLWNGILIGAAAGAGATAVGVRQRCGDDRECLVNAGLVVGFVVVPAAAAVGALVDRLIGHSVVYRAASAAPGPSRVLTVSPRIGPEAAGFSVAWRF